MAPAVARARAAARAVDEIESPIDLKSIPLFYRRKNGILLYFLLTSSLLASMALGIDGVSHYTRWPSYDKNVDDYGISL